MSYCRDNNIHQLDGNCSLLSDGENIQDNLISNRVAAAVHLPSIASYNVRSFFPKVRNIRTDILERGITLGFFSEIWEQSENKKHKFLIESMLETDGLKYISTPRPKGWGGAAIVANQRNFKLEKLDVAIPHNLEVVWGLLSSKSGNARFRKILVCSFYSPPRSKKNQKMTDHLVTTLHMLVTKHPEAPIIMGADKNSMDIRPILTCGLKIKQLVDLPTRNGKILDIILTNIPQHYNSPIIIPPVPCDNPEDGLPSDHWVPVCYPHTDPHKPPVRRYRTVTYRPLPDENVRKFGKWMTSRNWETQYRSESLTAHQHAEWLQKLLISKLDEVCPPQTMRISFQDKPFINKELKVISRRKQREYTKNGKSQKYKKLKIEFDAKYRIAAQKFMNKKVKDLKETQPGKAYSILKSMGTQPGDCSEDQTFTLPGHQNMSAEQSAEKIAEHFAAISQEYSPLDVNLLPARVRKRLAGSSNPPKITEYDCFKKLQTANKPKSVIPGDLPNTIVKEFTVELAKPYSELFNNIIQTASWPELFKIEHITPIAKIPQPQTEDDLRPISLTSFPSKVLEQFIVGWLLEAFGHKLDFRQYGGFRGNSINHYLMEFISFILHQQEMESTSVLACLVDFSKAFNRQDHSILITKLSDLGTPGWLLKLVIAFLTNRKMKVKYKGAYSKLFSLPGGGPQGSLLGLFLFLVLINDVWFEAQVNNTGELITKRKKVKEINEIHLKYVDDLALAETIDMKEQLEYVPVDERQQPDDFRARTGLRLKEETSRIRDQLNKTLSYAKQNGMRINLDKTKLMLFNPCISRDFVPEMTVDNTRIELVEQTKLLGVIITSDLKWENNTQYIIQRCNSKMWTIRRLKNLGASADDLIDIYFKQIRSILEFACPVWNASLTGEDIVGLERVQKTVLHIILGDQYFSYSSALKATGLEKLTDRRKKLSINFAKKAQKTPKFSNWFQPNPKIGGRTKQPQFCPAVAKTERFQKSPISELIKLLNTQ